MSTPTQSQRTTALDIYTRFSSVLRPHYHADRLHHTAHIPRVLDAEQAAELPLPTEGSAEQTVALVNGGDFHREDASSAAAADAYTELPRTRIYESIHTRSDGWYSLVALYLQWLLQRTVVCTLYVSYPQDRSLGAHDDAWDGIIVQLHGTKHWQIWSRTGGETDEVVTRGGDVLLLPHGVTHEVTTPEAAGSKHLVFALTKLL